MMAFGGAGPVHAFEVAKLLHCPQLIIPVGAGVTSALGFLVSPLASEKITSLVCPLAEMDWSKVNKMLAEMEEEGRSFLKKSGINKEDINVERIVDMRYSGQGHEITVSIPTGELNSYSIPEIEQSFKEEYELRYNRSIHSIGIETVTWRVVVSGPTPELQPTLVKERSEGEAYKGTRPVYFSDLGTNPIECPVYDRYLLKTGIVFDGPAIIEEQESTSVIGPNTTIRVDTIGNIIIDIR